MDNSKCAFDHSRHNLRGKRCYFLSPDVGCGHAQIPSMSAGHRGHRLSVTEAGALPGTSWRLSLVCVLHQQESPVCPWVPSGWRCGQRRSLSP